MSWIRVNRQNKCPICGKDSWCELSDDGAVALCMRSISDHPKQFKSGETGYIHRLTDAPRKSMPFKREEPRPLINAEAMMNKWCKCTSSGEIFDYAHNLGVKASALMELRAAHAREHRSWAWPMRNGYGVIVGIRLRGSSGDKWAVTGSKQGLFLPFCIPQNRLLIVEGNTDCAAGLSMGYFTVGRPSCNGGLADILILIKRLGIKEAVILADNDTDRDRPDGTTYNPGIDGANSLSERLTIPCCVVTLPDKDLRQSVNNGLTAEVLENMIKQTRYLCPKK